MFCYCVSNFRVKNEITKTEAATAVEKTIVTFNNEYKENVL